MPLYEYECKAKGHRTEVIQRLADAPLKKCPQCGSKVHKLLSAPAFKFKGSGWYVTDYGKGGAGSGEKSGGEGEGKDAPAKKESSSGEGGKGDGGGDSSTPANKSKKKAKAE